MAKTFNETLKVWVRDLEFYRSYGGEEQRKQEGTDCAFIVEIDWFNKFARWAQLAKAEEPRYSYYGNNQTEEERKATYMSIITEQHLENNNPGPISN